MGGSRPVGEGAAGQVDDKPPAVSPAKGQPVQGMAFWALSTHTDRGRALWGVTEPGGGKKCMGGLPRVYSALVK